MELKWEGPVFGQSGYEELTRGMVLALDKLGVIIELNPATNWNIERVKLDPEDMSRLIRMTKQRVAPNSIQICHQRPRSEYPQARKRICYSLFETNRCPDPWVADLNKMDRIWVFSEFNKKYWMEDWLSRSLDPAKIEVIPFGVNTELFHPKVKPAEITNKKGFAFLLVGDFTERKNFEGLIESFVTEFDKKDDVCLIIKAHYQGFVRRYQDSVMYKFREMVHRFNSKNPPQILFFGDKLPVESMPLLYTACDCFVLASRGEGLGIPFIEAMACGLPVISTNWSAPTDYITEENGLLVDCKVKQIDDIAYIQKCPHALNHSWAHPSIEDLRKKLRWVYENQDEVKKKGERGRQDMVGRTWQKTALNIIGKIRELK